MGDGGFVWRHERCGMRGGVSFHAPRILYVLWFYSMQTFIFNSIHKLWGFPCLLFELATLSYTST